MKQFLNLFLSVGFMVAVASCSENDPFEKRSGETGQTLAIKVTDENGVPIDGKASVIKNRETISQLELSSGVNHIPIQSDAMWLFIEKEGFEPYRIELTGGNSKSSALKIIHVILKSVLAFTVDTAEDDDSYVIDLDGSGAITILWPDGTIEQGNMPVSFNNEFDRGTNRPVVIKGAIAGIKSFIAFGYNTSIRSMYGLKNMSSLEVFFPGNIDLSEQLDLSHNRNLTSIDLFNAGLPRWLKLPQQHNIHHITLSLADRNITSSEVGKLVDNLYKTAVKKNIMRGTIALTGTDTPAPKTVGQIEVLITKFNWTVDLNL